jgi:hypothetical protein
MAQDFLVAHHVHDRSKPQTFHRLFRFGGKEQSAVIFKRQEREHLRFVEMKRVPANDQVGEITQVLRARQVIVQVEAGVRVSRAINGGLIFVHFKLASTTSIAFLPLQVREATWPSICPGRCSCLNGNIVYEKV